MATDKIINTPYSMQTIINEVLARIYTDDIGTIKLWPFLNVPAGHLEFNGAILLKADYSELWQKALNNNMVGTGLFFEDVDSTRFKIADSTDMVFRNYTASSGLYDQTSFNASITSGSKVVTGIGYTSFMFVGMSVTGTGIPAGTTILSIDSNTQVTLSANATATQTSYLTFTGRKFGSVELGQIENITGSLYAPTYGSSYQTGAFTISSGATNQSGSSASAKDSTINFDSSRVVKAGPETRPVNRSVKYIIKAKNIIGVDPVVYNANAATLGGLSASAFAYALGSPSNKFQMAAGINANEGVNIGQFDKLLATNGYQKLPSGMIMQWGQVTFASQTTVTATFPMAFPNQCVYAHAVPISAGNWYDTTTSVISNSSATFCYSPNAIGVTMKYTAIGY